MIVCIIIWVIAFIFINIVNIILTSSSNEDRLGINIIVFVNSTSFTKKDYRISMGCKGDA